MQYADGRAESPWESLLRLLHQLCDVSVEPQYVIGAAGGSFRADLRIVGTRRLTEYDGDVHRQSAQHGKDLDRDTARLRSAWRR